MAMDLSPDGESVVSGGGGNILARTVLRSEIKMFSHSEKKTASPTPLVPSSLPGTMEPSVAYEMQDWKDGVGLHSVFLEDEVSLSLPSKGLV